jgi:hypothetical protein
MSIRSFLWLLPALACTGCASVTSRVLKTDNPTADGLVYYMPRKDVIVTVTLAAATAPAVAAPTIKIETSTAYADNSRAFVANYRRNLIGKNQLTMVVNTQGLLESSKAQTTSNLAEIIKEMAGAAGTIGALTMDPASATATVTCPATASVVMRIPVDEGAGIGVHQFNSYPNCPIVVEIKGVPKFDSVKANVRSTRSNPRDSGFFYRQNRPYKVHVVFGHWEADDLVQLPNDAPIQFLPVERSLFANNLSDLKFTDGMPTTYGQEVDGELLAVAKLPAEVIKAYFAAVGNVFSQKKSAVDNEQQYLASVMTLMQKQAATEACLVAMQAKDDALIAAKCK